MNTNRAKLAEEAAEVIQAIMKLEKKQSNECGKGSRKDLKRVCEEIADFDTVLNRMIATDESFRNTFIEVQSRRRDD